MIKGQQRMISRGLWLAIAFLWSSIASAQQARVFNDGPAVVVYRAPDWQSIEFTLGERIYRKSHREALIITWSVQVQPGEYKVDKPWMAALDGQTHYLIPGMIWDSNKREWVSRIATSGLSNDWTAWDQGYVMVNAETGRVSDIPVVVATCDRCDFKDTGPIFDFKKPKEAAGPSEITISALDNGTEAATATREQALAAGARAAIEQSRESNRRQSQNPLKRQIGAEICRGRIGSHWETAGFTEGVSPDNEKIQIRIVAGPAKGEVIWDDPTDWELCSINLTR